MLTFLLARCCFWMLSDVDRLSGCGSVCTPIFSGVVARAGCRRSFVYPSTSDLKHCFLFYDTLLCEFVVQEAKQPVDSGKAGMGVFRANVRGSHDTKGRLQLSIVAVERAIVILKVLARTPGGVGVRSLSRELGYSPAVTQKSLQALVVQGFAVQDPSNQQYVLGPGAVALGLAALRTLDVREVAKPILKELTAATGETALLGVSRDDVAVYIDHVPSAHEVRMSVVVGDPRPYNCTAVGKVLLADLPENAVEAFAASGAFKHPTEHSISDMDGLKLELEEIRRRGYAIDDQEYSLGARCVAAPIRDFDGDVVAAVAIAGPVDRVTGDENLIVDEVRSAGMRISKALGWHEANPATRSHT